jgi:hypothetical protein
MLEYHAKSLSQRTRVDEIAFNVCENTTYERLLRASVAKIFEFSSQDERTISTSPLMQEAPL